MIIKSLLEHSKYVVIASVVYTLLLTYLCLETPNVQINLGSQSDKVYHALAYLVYTVVWYLTFRFTFAKSHFKALSYVFVLALSYGILIEVLQHYLTVNRQGDYKDVLANVLGTLIAVLVINLINTKTVKS